MTIICYFGKHDYFWHTIVTEHSNYVFMNNVSKPRVVKDYDALDSEIQEQLRLSYPYGFDKHLITFKNQHGKFVSALPFETEDRYYLVRMTRAEAVNIILEDEAYDDDGNLKDDIKEELTEKYDDNIDVSDIISEDDDDMDDFPADEAEEGDDDDED